MAFAVHLLKLTYFMLPAYFATMAPVFAKYIFSKKMLAPIDLGTELGHHPIFGKHKTFGGLVFGVLVAMLIGYLQFILYPQLWAFSLIEYHTAWAYASFLLGLGALTGDLAKSFLKRRFNLKPGKPWLPYDELDFAIGALIFVSPVYFPGWINSLLIVIVSMLADTLTNWIGYLMHLRKKSDVVDLSSYFKRYLKKFKRKS